MHLPLIVRAYGRSSKGDSLREQFGCRGASGVFVKSGCFSELLFTCADQISVYLWNIFYVVTNLEARKNVRMNYLFSAEPDFNLTYKTPSPGRPQSRRDQRSKINYWRGRFDSEFVETKAKIPALQLGREGITSNFSDNFYYHYLLVETG